MQHQLCLDSPVSVSETDGGGGGDIHMDSVAVLSQAPEPPRCRKAHGANTFGDGTAHYARQYMYICPFVMSATCRWCQGWLHTGFGVTDSKLHLKLSERGYAARKGYVLTLEVGPWKRRPGMEDVSLEAWGQGNEGQQSIEGGSEGSAWCSCWKEDGPGASPRTKSRPIFRGHFTTSRPFLGQVAAQMHILHTASSTSFQLAYNDNIRMPDRSSGDGLWAAPPRHRDPSRAAAVSGYRPIPGHDPTKRCTMSSAPPLGEATPNLGW